MEFWLYPFDTQSCLFRMRTAKDMSQQVKFASPEQNHNKYYDKLILATVDHYRPKVWEPPWWKIWPIHRAISKELALFDREARKYLTKWIHGCIGKKFYLISNEYLSPNWPNNHGFIYWILDTSWHGAWTDGPVGHNFSHDCEYQKYRTKKRPCCELTKFLDLMIQFVVYLYWNTFRQEKLQLWTSGYCCAWHLWHCLHLNMQ